MYNTLYLRPNAPLSTLFSYLYICYSFENARCKITSLLKIFFFVLKKYKVHTYVYNDITLLSWNKKTPSYTFKHNSKFNENINKTLISSNLLLFCNTCQMLPQRSFEEHLLHFSTELDLQFSAHFLINYRILSMVTLVGKSSERLLLYHCKANNLTFIMCI